MFYTLQIVELLSSRMNKRQSNLLFMSYFKEIEIHVDIEQQTYYFKR